MSEHYRHLARLRESAIDGARGYYQSSGLRESAVPVLVGITGACENVSTLFTVESGSRVHLTQTGQLALEHALCEEAGVWCMTSSFRTDKIDERHLNEFTLIEEELGCNHPVAGMTADNYNSEQMFEVLLSRLTGAVRAIIRECLASAGDHISALGGDVQYLETVASQNFRRITYTEAIDLLNGSGGIETPWGADLSATHERRLIEILDQQTPASLPTIVTHYPEEIKFFNMKVRDSDARVVQSADLLLPGVGEAVGSAVREHRYANLLERLTGSVMFQHITEQGLATINDFYPYLDLIKDGQTPPHAGYGIGLERVLQFIIGSADIRKASVSFYLSDMMGFTKALSASQAGSKAPGF